MLKRLWIALSVLWSMFSLWAGSDKSTQFDTVVWAVSIPWILGIVIWGCWYFIRGPKTTTIRRY